MIKLDSLKLNYINQLGDYNKHGAVYAPIFHKDITEFLKSGEDNMNDYGKSLTTQIMEQSDVVIQVLNGEAIVIKDRQSSDFPRQINQQELENYLKFDRKVVVCNFKVR
jgi:ribonucleotide reductase alpha subunit